jgi:hypothetical protein
MSFAGSALNMIRSLKDNRGLLQLGRDKRRAMYKKMVGKSSINVSDVSVEELEKTQKELKEYKVDSKNRTNNLMIISFGILIVTVLVLFFVFKSWLF